MQSRANFEGDIASSFAHRINAQIETQGFVLHSVKLGLHDKGGQKGGGHLILCPPTLLKVGGHVSLPPPPD